VNEADGLTGAMASLTDDWEGKKLNATANQNDEDYTPAGPRRDFLFQWFLV